MRSASIAQAQSKSSPAIVWAPFHCQECATGTTILRIIVNSARTSEGTDLPSSKCPPDPFVLVPEKSKCIDQQTLKLQELPDNVPVGELPRHILLTVDRYPLPSLNIRCLVNRVFPGTRVTINGIFSIFHNNQVRCFPFESVNCYI